MQPLNSGNVLQDIAFINLERLQGGQSVYAGASLNALLGNQAAKLNRSARASGRSPSRAGPQSQRPSRNQQRTSQNNTQTQPLPGAETTDQSSRWSWEYMVKHLSLSYFAENYFGPFLQHMTTKVGALDHFSVKLLFELLQTKLDILLDFQNYHRDPQGVSKSNLLCCLELKTRIIEQLCSACFLDSFPNLN